MSEKKSRFTVTDYIPDNSVIPIASPVVKKKSRFTVIDVPKNHYIPPNAVIEKINQGRFTFTPVGNTPLRRDIDRRRRVTFRMPNHNMRVTKGPEQKKPEIIIPLTNQERKKIERVVGAIVETHKVPPKYKITSIKGNRITVSASGNTTLPQNVSVKKTVVMEHKDGSRPPIKKMGSLGGKSVRNRRKTIRVKKSGKARY